ncbi:hypothetical protein GCM10027425_27830 [Alteromonas gracilis]
MGAATVWAAGLLLLVTFVALTLAGVGGVLVAHRQAQAAADLAALAGAGALQEGQDSCTVADVIAARNGASLIDCREEGAEVVVSVEVEAAGVPAGPWRLVGRARAGPAG